MISKEKLLQQYSDFLRMRNYSEQTYKAYMGTIRMYWKWCEERRGNPRFDKKHAVQSYLAFRMSVQKRDYSTVNGDYSALQWFYKYVLNRKWDVQKLIRPKKEKRLPKYISPQQVNQLVEATNCRKHKIIFLLFYSTGLRLNELQQLKWEDIKFEEGIIQVLKGKGNKDRIVVLHEQMEVMLQEMRKEQNPNQILVFEGNTVNKPIAPRSVQWAFINARRKAGLAEWVTPHVLRHSFATVALRNQTDLLTLKELLGHKKLATTARYVHLNIDFLKSSHNPLNNECLTATIQEVQKPVVPQMCTFTV
jgi:integrase/recombinase XerD